MPGTSQQARLTAAAADMYLLTSDFALLLGLLSWDQYLLRLRFIRDATEPGSLEAKAVEEMLNAEDFVGEEDWPIGDPTKFESGKEPLESQLFIPNGAVPPLLHFLAAASVGLSQWRFHLGDGDFFPSIPHGHWLSDTRKKLDAYRGWIYEEDRQNGREPRWKIIALWNDEKFRSFAARAIDYYLTHFPHYVWPVPDPRRLPRRR